LASRPHIAGSRGTAQIATAQHGDDGFASPTTLAPVHSAPTRGLEMRVGRAHDPSSQGWSYMTLQGTGSSKSAHFRRFVHISPYFASHHTQGILESFWGRLIPSAAIGG
jgi:hypothetical protein